jgi:hypothetical protein
MRRNPHFLGLLLSAGVTFLAASPSLSQQTANAVALTNQDVLLMTKSSFDDATIMEMIKSHEPNFDLSVAAVVKLKEAGVSPKVIQAMLAASRPSDKNAIHTESPDADAATTAKVPAGLEEVGVYVRIRGKLMPIEPEIVNWRTGGVLKSMATVGLDKGHVNGSIAGAHSNLRLASPPYMSPDALDFYVHCAEGGSAAEYQLLRLWTKEDRREFRSVTGGVLHASGGAQDNVVPFEYKKIAPRVYRLIIPKVNVGEYGLLAPGAIASANAASQGKIYTFRIVE